MENKKTIIAIIIVLILIIGITISAYLYNKFNSEQLQILTEEINKIIESDITTSSIDLNIKSQKKYGTVEKSIKDYILKLQNIYKELESANEMNPNTIFNAENIKNNYQEVENIIKEYKEKGKSSLEEYKKLVEEEEIMKNINEKTFSFRKNYFINLYKTVMLSDVMKSKYENLQNKIEKIKDDMYDKADKLSKIEKYLKENEKYWEIKDDKIEFKNISVMTQYYSLLNQLID